LTTITAYPLGRRINHDERSRAYAAPRAQQIRSVLHAHTAPVLDQGQVGSCTGNALAQLLNTELFSAARARVHLQSEEHPGGWYLTEDDALRLYTRATEIDDFPGAYPGEDTGSSGLAVAKAGVEAGYLTGYQHAFGFAHFLDALMLQPVIVGTAWYEAMYEPNTTGIVTPRGANLGGHEYLAIGIDVAKQHIIFLNSWGDGWAKDGRFRMTFTAFSRLLADQGDVVAPKL
jgi:hypothetical protein